MHKVKYYRDIQDIEQLTQHERDALRQVTERFAFRANDYYLSLIDWDDPACPIRRLIIPHTDELEGWGRLDPSNEEAYTVLPGLEHKYHSTALLLVSNICEGICRYCFRKRVFIDPQKESLRDIPAAIEYIAAHPKITNILLTGGDPLVLATRKLEQIISELRKIEHVRIIRLGTRMPVFNPYRILDDPALAEMISTYSLPARRIYVMTHFCHPRELTDTACAGLDKLVRAGAVLTNQFPLIRGVNDDPDVLAELLGRLSFAGVVPYYLFQCRPALGNHAYTVPIEEGYAIYEAAKARVSGLAKRLRFVMSHATGKIEILSKTDTKIFFKYHRAADDADSGKVLVCNSNPDACWLDDYEEILREYPAAMPYRIHGPE
ncbi:MAG TPA: KamA family radical SAM protein [Phycisphaerales bacterium]|nr:KamA family radical SAM protein [Phycisphaerales bacterium]